MQLLRRDIERLMGPEQSLRKFLRLLLSYRLLPVILLRGAQTLRRSRIPLFPDVLSMLNFVLFGLEVAKQCEIGGGLLIAHPQGVILGAERIGENVTVFSGVTLGARGLGVPFRGEERPVIGSNVTIGTGAKILGRVRIGDGAIIGANAVVIHDVPAGAVAAGVPAVVRSKAGDV